MDNPYWSEILEQPAAILAAAAGVHDQIDVLADIRRAAETATHVVFTGMGSSHDVCLAAASVLGSAGLLATTVNTAELVHFRLSAMDERTLLVAVSQSGRSAELVRLGHDLGHGHERPRLVSVTNGVDNQLADTADLALDTRAGDEVGPSTKTFAASCVALNALTRVMTGQRAGEAAGAVAVTAGQAARESRRLLTDPARTARWMGRWVGDRTSVVLVGRGAARATAEMGALVLKEVAGCAAESLDAAEFRHGPLEMAGPRLAVAVLATEPATLGFDVALAGEVAAHGAAVLLLTARHDTSNGPTTSNGHGGSHGHAGAGFTVRTLHVAALDRMLAPAVGVIPFQLLAWQLAVQAGRDPGQFITAAKVTTRE